ncbi:MAG: 5-formyltetrahydrofolate cyclo-ligase [Cyanobacteriota bacterium]|nr:5-formyltetrahydrofolate cyclo-ligase [Cyanobacteriota bacterium]
MSKLTIRRSLLKQRQSLSPTEWRQKSDRLVSHLRTSGALIEAKTILAYFSFRQEPDLKPLFTESLEGFNPASKLWGFPRCVGESLSWHLWQPGDLLAKGTYGILEPEEDATILDPSEVDLILVPAVGCDRRGYRVGYGGGFYDRMLSLPEWASKPTIGIVFDFAFLPELPVDVWDKRLHGVCTENELLMVSC